MRRFQGLLPSLFLFKFILVLLSSTQAWGSYTKSPVLKNDSFIWESNDSGIFSHFFQMKFVNHVAHNLNRSLTIASFETDHNKDAEAIVLCDIFELSGINCQRQPTEENKQCMSKVTSFLGSKKDSVCFGGYLWGKSGLVPVKHRLSVMFLEPRMKFREQYIHKFVLAKELLRQKVGSSNYTVVHWRRGDQLTTRCKKSWKGLKDNSVNCKSAPDLVQDVRGGYGGNNGEPVIVATNERNESTLDTLRRNGFIIFHDILAALPNMTSLDEFVTEVQVMMDAQHFISYGISNVNDQIEYERLRMGKSWCIKPFPKEENSWCRLYKAAMSRHLKDSLQQRNNSSVLISESSSKYHFKRRNEVFVPSEVIVTTKNRNRYATKTSPSTWRADELVDDVYDFSLSLDDSLNFLVRSNLKDDKLGRLKRLRDEKKKASKAKIVVGNGSNDGVTETKDVTAGHGSSKKNRGEENEEVNTNKSKGMTEVKDVEVVQSLTGARYKGSKSGQSAVGFPAKKKGNPFIGGIKTNPGGFKKGKSSRSKNVGTGVGQEVTG